MLRSDKLGITSVIRDLALAPGCYPSMIHFFRSSAWSLESIRSRWFSAVKEHSPLYKEGNFHILVGDGVKQSKEGRRIPGVKKLFQESENSAKPEYIHGHMFGGLGILAGTVRNWACIPLSIRLHDGLQAARAWNGAAVSGASHVVQMVEDAYHAALTFGDYLLLLDRYFLTVPALDKLRVLNRDGDVRMEIITKAKKSCTAYEKPGPRKPGRGRPPKKGAAVHLKELFLSHREKFQEAEIELYGKKESIHYHCVDLLWGQKLYQELRFVLVEMDGIQSILASTSLELEPLSESRPGDRNAYGSVLHCHGNPPEHFRQLVGEIIVQPASLSKNAFQRKGIGGCTYGPPAEILFPVYGKIAGITYNANNSEATRLVRKLLGFPGFLMVQTFYSQVI